MAPIKQWLTHHPLSAIEVDCATTVMLKILDGKCKMPEEEKVVMAELYDEVKHLNGELFEQNHIHTFIASARGEISEAKKLEIYEQRLMAETMLSRPVMKKFKARIRSNGLFQAVEIV